MLNIEWCKDGGKRVKREKKKKKKKKIERLGEMRERDEWRLAKERRERRRSHPRPIALLIYCHIYYHNYFIFIAIIYFIFIFYLLEKCHKIRWKRSVHSQCAWLVLSFFLSCHPLLGLLLETNEKKKRRVLVCYLHY